MTLRHFINTLDYSKEELLDLIELTRILKVADKQGYTPKLLRGASLGMIFEEPSTRTRISFEVAMTKLGGHALYLKPGEIHLGGYESLSDTATVVSRMVDVVMIRALKHETVAGFAEAATVPVINGLTDYTHPTQVVCDVFTMMENKLPEKALEDLKVVFVGSGTGSVMSSLMFITTKMGMNFTLATPDKYRPPDDWVQSAEENCKVSRGTVVVTPDVDEAVKDADFIYTDLWWWVDMEDQIPERRAAFMPHYQINMGLLQKAPAHCKVMHCLPASRGVEATDEALDSPQSIIFDQSENRLHAEKGILAWLTYPRLNHPSEELKAYHRAQAEAFMDRWL
jgi:putrescine carbamoyltransferase